MNLGAFPRAFSSGLRNLMYNSARKAEQHCVSGTKIDQYFTLKLY